MTKKIILTMGVGPHESLLNISRPAFQSYAALHGYDYKEVSPENNSLPPSWWKIFHVQEQLAKDIGVLWFDADLALLTKKDIWAEIPESKHIALVEHKNTNSGDVPNFGMFAARPTNETITFLAKIWDLREKYKNHPWWEQAAALELIGYSLPGGKIKSSLVKATEFYEIIYFLPLAWNVHPETKCNDTPHIIHCTMGNMNSRINKMKNYLKRASDT